METKKPIGLIIKEIIDEKDLKPASVAAKMGKSRQYVYDTIQKRESMSVSQIEVWANALGVDKSLILEKMGFDATASGPKTETDESGYLMRRLSELEALFRDSLVEKDRQIMSLTETVKMLAGKYEQVA